MDKRYAFLAGLVLSSCRPIEVPPKQLHYTYPLPVMPAKEDGPANPSGLDDPLENRIENIIEKECIKTGECAKQEAISPEYRALLDTIAWAEGTDCHYNMMMGRMLFKDYSAHPIETKEMPEKGIEFGPRWRKQYSTAAGRYQFLYRTYNNLKEKGFFQTGFSPEEQDKAALYLIAQSNVTQEVLEEAVIKKEFIDIWDALSGEWASLPHKKTKRSRYRFQYAYKEENLEKIFLHFYEIYAKP